MRVDDAMTICSVSFYGGNFIRLNELLVRNLNPDAHFRWIVAENTPKGTPGRLEPNGESMLVIEGVGSGHLPMYHHTLALAKCIERADTRFIAVIDPDLYVIRRSWISDILSHMVERELALIGVPWHPYSRGKYRYFPAVHFSVFDLKRFNRCDIDFRPDFPNGANDPEWPQGWSPNKTHYFARSRWARRLASLPFLAQRRQYYTDTGSRLYKHWVDAPYFHYDILTPVWNPADTWIKSSLVGSVLERILPDELCYHPKHYPHHTGDDFLAPLSGGKAPARWERFTWRGEPFCFHLRRNIKRNARNIEQELSCIEQIVRSCVNRQDS